MSRTLVLAGNHVEFDDWKRRTMPGASTLHVRYLGSARDIEGMKILSDDELITIGTYWRRRDLLSIVAVLEMNVLKSRDPSPQVHALVRSMLGREPL